MAFEKAKVLKAAEKFLAQGKISAAIKEYRQIIKNDGDDLTALNMLGDLLARAGEKDEAVSCFSRIAEHYRDQQFRLKAIAMYKKIEKLKPRDPVTANTLAELYDAQGLAVDARAQYLIVADAYTRAGQTKETLEVLHKIADLDSHNTDIRLKLAEGYLKEQMFPEAARAYGEAANRMLEKGDFEGSLAAYGKAFELNPDDKSILKGLVSAHSRLGSAEDAAELLEKAIADQPDDMDLVSMLAQAYVDAENAPGAEQATAQLMADDASNYRRYIEVARAYLHSGEEDETARILGLVIEQMLAGREENDLLELVNELLTRSPEHVGGLRLLSRIHWWQRDMDKLRSALERLAESAEVAGLTDDERYALTQLVRLAPDERRFVERLEALGGSLEDVAEVAQMEDPSLAGVPSFETFSDTIATPEGPEVKEGEFVWNSVAEEPFREDTSSSFADLNETEFATEIESDVKVLTDDQTPAQFQEFVFNTEDLGPAAAQATEVQEGPDAEKVQSMMQQELESVDFYITQGYSDIAIDTLELLERQFGSHPDIDARRQQLQTGAPAVPSTMQSESASEFSTSEPATQIETESVSEVTFAEVEELPAPAPDATVAPPVAAERAGSGIDSGLAEIFEEFRLEAEGEPETSNEDFETHYNMATAYKEMDLLDEAIREFQIAANLTRPADGTPRYFQCCNMLGHCFVQKSMPRAAVLWFKKGIEAPGRSPEEYKALQYELGSAYEQMGDLTRAIATFTEVYGLDVGYRDIGEKLHDLQARQSQQKKKKKGRSW
jgi:tetratricopeptide (TPR) repeat protein